MPDPVWVDGTTPLNSVNMTKLQTRDEKAVANGYASLDGTAKVPAAQLPLAPAGASGTLAARPAASASPSTFYYASDQDVLYFSTGSAWLRIGLPAGATTQVYSNTVPTGWVAYNGTALPASTGIYADLYAALGNTTATPDTTGRTVVAKGSHADVDALGDSDGVAAANRTPKHNTTNALGISRTADVALADGTHYHGIPKHNSGGGDPGVGLQFGAPDLSFTSGWSGSSISVSQQPNFGLTGSIGPGGTRPVDGPAYIVFSVVIAKL